MNSQDILMGGGVPAVKFDTIGDGIVGTCVRIHDARQATDPATKTGKTWKSGDPIMQVPIEIKSDADGETYMLYVQQGSDRQRALAAAVREAGSTSVEEGARIGMRWVGEEASSMPGAQPKKLYQGGYSPPASKGGAAVMDVRQPAEQTNNRSNSGLGGLFTATKQTTVEQPPLTMDNLPPEVVALLSQLKK